jgi:hypothetical protein
MVLVCGPQSTTILESSKYFEKVQVVYPAFGAAFRFYDNELSNPNCAITNYELTVSSNSVVAPQADELYNIVYPVTLVDKYGVGSSGRQILPVKYTIDE